MGSGISATTVSVLAEGEPDSPFSIRRCPGYAKGIYKNPPEFQTMQDLELHSFKNYPDSPSLGYRKKVDGKFEREFVFKTFKECEEIARAIGSAFYHIGLKDKEFFGVYSENRMEWGHCIDVSALFGFCLVSLYDSFGLENLSFIIGHSKVQTLIVSEVCASKLCQILSKDKHELKRVIVITEDNENKVLDDIRQYQLEVYTWNQLLEIGRQHPVASLPKVDKEDPHYICYSSGTTGTPKGVIISHRSQTSNTLNCWKELDFRRDERHLSYLPLPHVFERIGYSVTHFVGGRIGFYSGNIRLLTEDMQIFKPTHLNAVPRVISRINDVVMKKLANSSSITRGFFWASWYWKRFWVTHGYETPLSDRLVFNNIKNNTGGAIRSFIIGGAALDPSVHEFMQVALDTPMRVGYGLSEIGAGNICNPLSVIHSRPGTVGGPLCNCEVRLEPLEDYDDPLAGEIIMGGECLCSGYLYDQEATDKLFCNAEHTWLHTGDIGKWDQYGYLMVVDRMRSIFKLSQGEYVAADLITEIYQSLHIIDQIFVYGDSTRSFLVGVVVPNKEETAIFFGKDKITDEEFIKLCEENNKQLRAKILKDLDDIANEKKLTGFQKIKAICLEHDPWTVTNDLMTPTFKLKRKKLTAKYLNQIDKLYAETVI
ncbi:AMP-binding enzyme family protein [Trichomonas vaginalis G3]|uniref:AMP-binding enzyme family protein n=1 Tax=Trichomonas vaginalis (strain ATCC PRA-98 / G3) TaxID=412133 RepID=A2DQF3_TRIV3|nr:long chain fatty acid--CoA ligase family [Trichomonas vaginalis G3]EAY17410.1 AMP-binding enzyme family protein [Trichomonas vaginalis G3]KAI5491420.1 long chain fatty acid--CoA ligase family [Trichomonas vaginalis G3]|eukprot:XP_001330779.1 AMP-binding enzyme family protein [Trichomonas vaginalis G3]